MSHRPDHLTGPVTEGIGLRFLNEAWNDSISNGHLLAIRWNQVLDEARSPELGLFKITYPRDGDVVYELVSNLTGLYRGLIRPIMPMLTSNGFFRWHGLRKCNMFMDTKPLE